MYPPLNNFHLSPTSNTRQGMIHPAQRPSNYPPFTRISSVGSIESHGSAEPPPYWYPSQRSGYSNNKQKKSPKRTVVHKMDRKVSIDHGKYDDSMTLHQLKGELSSSRFITRRSIVLPSYRIKISFSYRHSVLDFHLNNRRHHQSSQGARRISLHPAASRDYFRSYRNRCGFQWGSSLNWRDLERCVWKLHPTVAVGCGYWWDEEGVCREVQEWHCVSCYESLWVRALMPYW